MLLNRLGFEIWELSKLFMYQDNDDNLQPFFDPNLEGKLQLRIIDFDSSILSFKTKDLIKDLERLQEEKDMFDFHNFAEDCLLYSRKTDWISKIKIGTSDTTFMMKYRAWRSKLFAFIKRNKGE